MFFGEDQATASKASAVLIGRKKSREYLMSVVSTKNKYHARDEEFRGHRSSHLEQFTNRPAIWNFLPLDVRSTFDEPDSALYKPTHQHY